MKARKKSLDVTPGSRSNISGKKVEEKEFSVPQKYTKFSMEPVFKRHIIIKVPDNGCPSIGE